jgi:hypothetical protein
MEPLLHGGIFLKISKQTFESFKKFTVKLLFLDNCEPACKISIQNSLYSRSQKRQI